MAHGDPPVTASNPPGADYGINVSEPKHNQDLIDPVEKNNPATLQPDQEYHGTGQPPKYMGLCGDSLIWTITFFATMGFSVSLAFSSLVLRETVCMCVTYA